MKSLAAGLIVGALMCSGAAFAQFPATSVTSGVSDAPPTLSESPLQADSAAERAAAAENAAAARQAAAAHPMSANEAAGLPDLAQINRPGAVVSSRVELNTVREPSFHTRDRSGTEITEYRDKGKPTEIDVRSNFGTRYSMSNPVDNSPRVPNNGAPNGRVPSIHLSY
nr:hypothetical protein [Robbsia andropogonis]